MPSLPQIATETLTIPSTEHLPADQQIVITYNTEITIGDMRAMNVQDGEIDNALAVLSRLITSWNYTEVDGVTVKPINPNTIAEFRGGDMTRLVAIVEKAVPKDLGIDLDQKKS